MHMRLLGRQLLTVATVLVLAGCGGPAPSTPPTAPVATSPSAPVSSPSAPSEPAVVIEVDRLAQDVALTTQVAVCDPDRGMANGADPQESTIFCGDGLTLGLRALDTAGIGPVDRLYLQRPVCDTSPCSRESLDTATVVGWVDGVASSVSMDSRTKVVQVRSPVSAAEWPSPGSNDPPSAERPAIPDSPAEIANLPPLPSCGETEFDQPADRHACFRDAVLAGRPAELLEHLSTTEGAPVVWLDRFDGRGPVLRYSMESGTWSRTAGALILEAGTGGWSFDPRTDTRTVLPG